MVRLNKEAVALLVVDVQEKFVPVLFEAERLIAACRLLIGGTRLLGVPIFVTEQNPDKLGRTVTELQDALGDAYCPIAKMTFSAFGSEEFRRTFAASGRTQLLLCGIETHVCVWQTALDALELGYEVFIAEDATTARHAFLWRSGVQSCVEAGAVRVNAEAALFELLGTAEHPQFRQVQALVKALAPSIYSR
ncbi:Isochorismatase family protein YecD [bacterium HR17]|jgi:nicotinamidase-related amidase|uniref:Isochorismatase family protein YecD n=1 Tax=Candidatus Fervidibacter japonicus TaxID=2035412 RepID=A0A2H5XCQ2_9BACT|nr:Isochorismatase family protein YecD [bacterium HR17]